MEENLKLYEIISRDNNWKNIEPGIINLRKMNICTTDLLKGKNIDNKFILNI